MKRAAKIANVLQFISNTLEELLIIVVNKKTVSFKASIANVLRNRRIVKVFNNSKLTISFDSIISHPVSSKLPALFCLCLPYHYYISHNLTSH
jgi:hypothetical protein